MNITVAICSWNRAELLRVTLECMKRLEIPEGVVWELLVVNNNCTDNTDEIINSFKNCLPIKRFLETKQGHSNARNCAIAHAEGDYLIWTDDDVMVDKKWVFFYYNAFIQYPTASFFGGTISPQFKKDPSKWIMEDLYGFAQGPFAIMKRDMVIRLLNENEEVFGANMAFKTQIAKRFMFNPDLGRNKLSLISGDETQVIRLMRGEGLVGVWVGPSLVYHRIPNSRLSKKYFKKFFSGIGYQSCVIENNAAFIFKGMLPPRWLIRKFIIELIKYHIYQTLGKKEWRQAFQLAYTWKGYLNFFIHYKLTHSFKFIRDSCKVAPLI